MKKNISIILALIFSVGFIFLYIQENSLPIEQPLDSSIIIDNNPAWIVKQLEKEKSLKEELNHTWIFSPKYRSIKAKLREIESYRLVGALNNKIDENHKSK